MKLSDLIRLLQDSLEEHGDGPVRLSDEIMQHGRPVEHVLVERPRVLIGHLSVRYQLRAKG